MTTKELFEAIATEKNLSKKDAKEIVDSVFAKISESLEKGDEVRINNFGTFKTAKSPAQKRKVLNLGVIDIPEKTHAKFKASKTLKDKLNPSAE